MKTLKAFGMAAIAVLMGVGFASCTKEGNPQYNLVKNEKKLVQLEIEDSNNKDVYHFSYDNEGRLHESTNAYINITYRWSNSEITPSQHETYVLENGLIRHWRGHEITYNNDGRPTRDYWDYDEYDIYAYYNDFNWSGNKLTNIGYYQKEGNASYAQNSLRLIYNEGITCKGYNPIVPILMSVPDDHLCVAHPELMGARTNQLPNTFEISIYNRYNPNYIDRTQGNFSYKFDDDGYVTECIMNDPSSGETKYTMVWE